MTDTNNEELDRILLTLFHSYDGRGNQLAIDEAKAKLTAWKDRHVEAERDRWMAASMKRLAKYDEIGILPETQALIDEHVAEARISELMRLNSLVTDSQFHVPSRHKVYGYIARRKAQLSQTREEGK
jgi:hypothetical protein